MAPRNGTDSDGHARNVLVTAYKENSSRMSRTTRIPTDRHRRDTPLVATLFAATGSVAALAGGIGAIALRVLDHVPVVGNPFGFGDVALVGFAVMGVAFASVGALLVVRRPRNAVGWCMVLIGVVHALGVLAGAATSSLVAEGTQAAFGVAQLTGWVTYVLVSLGGGLLFGIAFIFPTGRGHTPRWESFVRLLVIGAPIALLVMVLQPGTLPMFPTIENPFGVGPDLRLETGTSLVVPLLGVLSVPLLPWSLVSRYRLAGSVERQQLKWFGLAVVVTSGALGISVVGGSVAGDAPEIGLAAFGFTGALIPVAIGIAILRHNLFEIDRIISRTLAYGLVTAVLVAVFSSLVIGLQAALAPLTRENSIAVAISTLVVFAMFQPLRRGVQRTIDRRFDRARIDGERVAVEFAGRLRNQLDLGALRSELITTVDDSLRPSASSVWLRLVRQ